MRPRTISGCRPSTRRSGRESLRLSFIVNRPAEEPGFALERRRSAGRASVYDDTPARYATPTPADGRVPRHRSHRGMSAAIEPLPETSAPAFDASPIASLGVARCWSELDRDLVGLRR